VHISGLEDAGLSFADMLDGHRVLVGPKDRIGNVEQLRRLCDDGYDGLVSFEPFAKEVHELRDPIAAVRDSMAYLRQALAMTPPRDFAANALDGLSTARRN
jgi:2-keto-myo-inositol isomerase